MNLIRSLSASFSMSLAGTVLCRSEPTGPPPLVAGENAAPNLFANLLLKQGGEPAEAHQSRHKLLPIMIVPGGAWPTKCTTSINARY